MKILKNNQGFSLIEVLVTIFIVGILIGVFQATTNATRINGVVKDKELALRIASTEMETLRGLTYSGLPTSTTFTDPLMSSLPQGSGTLSFTDYNAKTKQVVVTVQWHEPNVTATSTFSLTTLITDGGL